MISTSTIFQKGLLLAGIPLVTQLIFLATLVKIRDDQAEAQYWVLHTEQVIHEAETLYSHLANIRATLRGYVITSDNTYVKQMRLYRTRWDEQMARLKTRTRDNPEQIAALERLDRQARQLFRWQDDIVLLVDRGDSTEAVTRVKLLVGKERMGVYRKAFDDFLNVERALDTVRLQDLQRQANLQNIALVTGGVLAIASTCLLGVLFARSIGSRLRVLTENTRLLAEGRDLLPPLHGNDELARVDRAFRDMAEAQAQRDRENDMFVYSVSHDLRSPLVNLQGFSQELALSAQDVRDLIANNADVPERVRQRTRKLIDGQIGEAIQFIQAAVTRLSGIIDALLRLSRAGRVEYRMQSVPVGPVVQRIVAALQNTLHGKKATVTVGDLPAVWGDPTALEQVFANLLGNAVNYLDPSRPGEIEVGCTPADSPDQVEFFVRDNGLGIPAEHQGKVFLAFQRLHAERAEGEGIGLTLVRRVVERHGGKIRFTSTAGVGTTFTVTLPTNGTAPLPLPASAIPKPVLPASHA